MKKAGKIVGALLVIVLIAGALAYQFLLKPVQYTFDGPPPKPLSAGLPASAGWLTLFDGKSLAGWTPKFTGYAAGINFADTWQLRDGAITATYENYAAWNGEFGNLFYETPFESYVLQLEYRFFGEQATDSIAMRWAWRNSGVMFHSESAGSMQLDQDFPVSIEAQLLGATAGSHRATANVCTPDTHINLHGRLHKPHCTNSISASYAGDQWVKFELEVHTDGTIRHFINGEFAMEYTRPVIDTATANGRRVADARADKSTALSGGYIALQSESHPVQFRNIRVYPLPAAGRLSLLSQNRSGSAPRVRP